jgi:regulator of sigma E protease
MEILHALFSNTLVAFILLIGVVVFVHELGHFLAGKAFGIQVEEFSIGFGPKAFSFQKGTTEYRINWLPLGGYVRFFGAEIQKTENLSLELQEKSILHAKVYKRAVVSLAGPLANFILSFFIIFGISLYGFPLQKPVVSVLPDSVAAKAGLSTGDHVLSINGDKVKDWEFFQNRVSKSPGKKLDLVVERQQVPVKLEVTPLQETVQTPLGNTISVGRIGVTPFFSSNAIVVFPQSLFQVFGFQTGDEILSLNENKIQYLFEISAQLQKIMKNASSNFDLASKITDQQLQKNSLDFFVKRRKPNSQETQSFHLILSFDDPKAKQWARLILQNQKLKQEEVQPPWQLLSSDQTVLDYENLVRGDKLLPAQEAWKKCGLQARETLLFVESLGPVLSFVQFQMWLNGVSQTQSQSFLSSGRNSLGTFPVKMKVLSAAGEFKNLDCQIPLRLGYNHLNEPQVFLDFPMTFLSSSRLFSPEIFKAKSFFEAFEKALESLVNQIQLLLKALKMLVTGSIPLSNLGGPIAIAGVAGDAAKGGWITFLMVTAFISTNIGLMNLLPFPALDGGALLLQAVEAAYGKPLPLAVQSVVQRVGIVFLFVLFVLVFYNDILRFLRL